MAIVTCCCFLFTGCVASGMYKFERLIYTNDKGTTVSYCVNDQFQGVRLKENSFVLLLLNDTFILRTENVLEPSISVMSGKVVKGIDNKYYFIFSSDSYRGLTVIANFNYRTISISFAYTGVTIFLKK